MTNNKDITLKPLDGMRGKRYDTLKNSTVTAIVELADSYTDNWNHPTVTLRKVRQNDDGTNDERELVSLRYQRHNVNHSAFHDRKSRGFLRGERGFWSHTYAPEIRGNFDNFEYVQTGMSLIERAIAASHKDEARSRKLNKADDPILRLIVGMRLIGITVVLRNAKPSQSRREYSLAA